MINVLDLFSGCGGLTDGFHKQGNYHTLGAIDWEINTVRTLEERLINKYGYSKESKTCIFFDLQRVKELLYGFNDEHYGSHSGLISLVNKNLDVIIGGPPCQAYSIAGRVGVKDPDKHDYRNFLFESYVEIVKFFRPKFFIFENVQGILSARPQGVNIVEEIQKSFNEIGYYIPDHMQKTLFDMSYFGIPQSRKRVIIFGVNKDIKNYESISEEFYNSINKLNLGYQTVSKEYLLDLPKLIPVDSENKRVSHESINSNNVLNHVARFHNKRDIEIFRILAHDIESGLFRYSTTESLIKLYEEKTGKYSNFHKYNVIRYDKPSNTIPAHLYKDGLRHIHPDSQQARTLTVREAARLQTFDDDFKFLGTIGDQYKMVGNAVPPKFSKMLADVITKFL